MNSRKGYYVQNENKYGKKLLSSKILQFGHEKDAFIWCAGAHEAFVIRGECISCSNVTLLIAESKVYVGLVIPMLVLRASTILMESHLFALCVNNSSFTYKINPSGQNREIHGNGGIGMVTSIKHLRFIKFE